MELPWWGWLLLGFVSAPFVVIVCGAIWDTFAELREEKKWDKKDK